MTLPILRQSHFRLLSLCPHSSLPPPPSPFPINPFQPLLHTSISSAPFRTIMSYYEDDQRGRQQGDHAPQHHQSHHQPQQHHAAAAAGPACGRCAGTGMFEGTTCPVCGGTRVDPSGATRSYAAPDEGAPGEDGERGFGKTALGAMAGGYAGHKMGGHGVLGVLAGAVGGHVLGSVVVPLSFLRSSLSRLCLRSCSGHPG